MRDVFLSYARKDRQRAVRLVEALERLGFSVWWDHDVVPGQNWQRELESAVRQTRSVVVLWSRDSVASDWVREEASLAREQGKLIPARLDDAEIHVPFRLIQTADLRYWDGEESHQGFRELVAGVRAHGDPPTLRPSPTIAATPKLRAWRRRLSVAWLVLPTMAVALVVLVLMNWPAPTEVDIDMIATSVQFRAHDTDRQVLLESIPARWLALQGFDQIRLTPAAVWIADPARHDFQHDTYSPDAWRPLPPGQPLALRPVARTEAAVTIQPVAKSDGSLAFGQIIAGPADLTLRSPEKGSLSVELRGEKLDGAVALSAEFRMDADRCVRESTPGSSSDSPLTFKVRLSESPRLLEYSSQRSGMRVAVGYPPDRKESFLGKAGFAVDQVRFLNQGTTGQPESTLAGAGVIRYPRYPAARPVPLSAGDFFILVDLREFHLRKIVPGEGAKSLQIRLGGVAGKISSGPAGSVRDRRLTYFDHLRQSSIITTLFAILAWMVPTLIAARNLYRDLHSAPGPS